jgi:DNA-binding sugar fermentation-stimulating protein
MLLMKLENVMEGVVVKRPSKIVKSPYVSDIVLCENQMEILGHSPSLGCCGLADATAHVLLTPIIEKKTKKTKNNNNDNNNLEKPKCTYSVCLAIVKDNIRQRQTIVGIHPRFAEQLFEKALQNNLLQRLKNCKSYVREKSVFIEHHVNSRFDFYGNDENNIPFYCEVKNVPLSDYEDIAQKEKKKMDFSQRDYDCKVAYFPDGYRKKTKDPVSPRALKHIQELTYLKTSSTIPLRCLMCYVVQRNDVNRFQISIIDPQYRYAVKEAIERGVEIIVLQVEWNIQGEAYFLSDELPLTSFNEINKII